MNDAIFVPDENIPLVTYNNEDGEMFPMMIMKMLMMIKIPQILVQ